MEVAVADAAGAQLEDFEIEMRTKRMRGFERLVLADISRH